jgi:hypothetical protein
MVENAEFKIFILVLILAVLFLNKKESTHQKKLCKL